MNTLKTFEISANGHLFGFWRAFSPEHAYKLISDESCTNASMDTYQITHHPELDHLSDEEIDEINLREVMP